MLLWAFAVSAQTLEWKTNFYAVAGSTSREIADSIARTRPVKGGFDGETKWNLTWRFTVAPTEGGCRCASVTTTLAITTTLPRWQPPADAAPDVGARWKEYITRLTEHETGHARFGLVSARELRKQLALVRTNEDCQALSKRINAQANRLVEDYKKREREYDVFTDHGRKR